QTQWPSIGPPVMNQPPPPPTNPRASGRMNTIAIDPTNTDTIYIGAANGGVWKTEDGGKTWRALTDTQCSIAMGSIAIDPSNNKLIYAGTGEENFTFQPSYYGCGVLKSTDGGVTWTQKGASVFTFPNNAGATIGKIAIAGNTLMVASDVGLFRSTNGGDTFDRVLGGAGNPVTDLVIDPIDPMTMYAAIGNIFGGAQNGVYKSTNGGANWLPAGSAFPTVNVG